MCADVQITGRAKPLHCKSCDAVIGMVVQRSNVRKLLLFAPGTARVMVEIKGDAEVHCIECGDVRKWFQDRQIATQELMQNDKHYTS